MAQRGLITLSQSVKNTHIIALNDPDVADHFVRVEFLVRAIKHNSLMLQCV